MTKEAEDSYVTAMAAEAKKLELTDALAGRRTITIGYRTLELEVQTQGIREEPLLRFATLARARGDKSPRLAFEADLFGEVTDAVALGDDVAEEITQARQVIIRLWGDHPLLSYAALCAKKAEVISHGGLGAKVDIAIGAALESSGGERLLVEKILRPLPSATSVADPAHVVEQLGKLRHGPLCRVVSKSAQALLQSALDAVTAIKGGRPPSVNAFESPEARVSLARMSCFCKCERDGGGSGSGESMMLTGALAAAQLLAHLVAKEPASGCTLSDLEPLHVFSWLLNGEQKETLQRLTKTALAGLHVARPSTGRPSSAGDGDGAEQAKKRAKLEEDNVMALFG